MYTYTIDTDLTRMMCMRRAFRSRHPRPEPWALLHASKSDGGGAFDIRLLSKSKEDFPGSITVCMSLTD